MPVFYLIDNRPRLEAMLYEQGYCESVDLEWEGGGQVPTRTISA